MIVAIAMWGTALAMPVAQGTLPGRNWLALAFGIAGLSIAWAGVMEFRNAKTTVDPRSPRATTTMVSSGIYRLSRNPMYVGFLLLLISWGLYLANWLVFLLLPLFIVYMNRFQIAPEEMNLQELFGDEYSAYKASVRRWL